MNELKTALKIFTVAFFVFFFLRISETEAQEISEWKIGISVDHSSLDFKRNFSGVNNFISPETGFSISVHPVFKINEDFSFITGLEYTYYNYSFPSVSTGVSFLEEIGNPHISYLNLPLLLNLHFLENLRSLSFTGGFRISQRMASTQGRMRETTSDRTREFNHVVSETSNNILLAYTIGIGYQLKPIGIELMYNQDVTPFFEILTVNNANSIFGSTFVKNPLWRRSVSLKVSYYF
jgi:hypothetical protein